MSERGETYDEAIERLRCEVAALPWWCRWLMRRRQARLEARVAALRDSALARLLGDPS